MKAEEADKIYGELIDVIHKADEKYIYYLLSISASTIAFALYQTKDAIIEQHHLLLAGAIACWVCSFGFGIYYLRLHRVTLAAQISKRMSTRIPEDKQEMINTHYKKYRKKETFYSNWQLLFLFIGALFFIAWHIFEMYLRTVITHCPAGM